MGYTGPYFDKNNQQTSMSGADTAQNVMTPVMRVGIILPTVYPFWRIYWSYAVWVIKQSLSWL